MHSPAPYEQSGEWFWAASWLLFGEKWALSIFWNQCCALLCTGTGSGTACIEGMARGISSHVADTIYLICQLPVFLIFGQPVWRFFFFKPFFFLLLPCSAYRRWHPQSLHVPASSGPPLDALRTCEHWAFCRALFLHASEVLARLPSVRGCCRSHLSPGRSCAGATLVTARCRSARSSHHWLLLAASRAQESVVAFPTSMSQ